MKYTEKKAAMTTLTEFPLFLPLHTCIFENKESRFYA